MVSGYWSLAGLFLFTFASEDAATLSGGYFASTLMLPWSSTFLACFLGIWFGDMGLYFLGRYCGRPVMQWICRHREKATQRVKMSEEWFARHGFLALVICRVVPGMRTPVYFSAGLLRMATLPFCLATGILAALWVLLLFWMVNRLGHAAPKLFLELKHHLVWASLALILFMVLLQLLLHLIARLRLPQWLLHWRQWEFWPAWLFYLPVVANYIRLSLKYGGVTLPSCANPGMFLSGLIGESKFETLAELQENTPELVARSFLLSENEARATQIATLISQGQIQYPFVMKPDMGQRGNGFRVIRTEEDVRAYLETVPVAIVVQQYIAGPHEAGIFYYRFPGEARGHLFAITEKVFPEIVGDGEHTLEELIERDERACMVAETYFRRFDGRQQSILAHGERLRLVEAGNHAQGCIFKDGMYLWSAELEQCIDEISQGIDGFFIGRYDVRYTSIEELRRGEGFHILELNGASAEPTSAYDASKTLGEAYRMLFRQWSLVFSIASQNRQRGYTAATPYKIITEWMNCRRRSQSYPMAD